MKPRSSVNKTKVAALVAAAACYFLAFDLASHIERAAVEGAGFKPIESVGVAALFAFLAALARALAHTRRKARKVVLSSSGAAGVLFAGALHAAAMGAIAGALGLSVGAAASIYITGRPL